MSEEKTSFIIPVSWSVSSTIRIEAENEEDAIRIAHERAADIPLSVNNEYIDDSYIIHDNQITSAQDTKNVGNILIRSDGSIERT